MATAATDCRLRGGNEGDLELEKVVNFTAEILQTGVLAMDIDIPNNDSSARHVASKAVCSEAHSQKSCFTALPAQQPKLVIRPLA